MERACPNCGNPIPEPPVAEKGAARPPEGGRSRAAAGRSAARVTCPHCRKRFAVPKAVARRGPELPLAGSAGTRGTPPEVTVSVWRDGEPQRRDVPFRAAEVTIGSAAACDVALAEGDARPVHAVIIVRGASDLAVADRSIDPGTRVGDRLLRGGEAPLKAGDTVEIGAMRLCVRPGATRRRAAGFAPCDRREPYAFVAHVRKDRDAVLADMGALRAAGVPLWWDAKEADPGPGRRWSDEVDASVQGAAAVLVFLSRNALDSMLLRALAERAVSLRKAVVPVALDRAGAGHDVRALAGIRVLRRGGDEADPWPDALVEAVRRGMRAPRDRPSR